MMWAELTLLKTISLPNATTWTCMVLVLVVMLFVRFSKPLQWRHWDLLLLFLLTIPLLYLRDSRESRDDALNFWCHPAQATSVLWTTAQVLAAPVPGADMVVTGLSVFDMRVRQEPKYVRTLGFEHQVIWRCYLWLLIVTAFLLIRSLIDLGLEQRAEFRSNVTTGGMIWLAMVMLAVMLLKSWLPEWRGVPQPQSESLVIKNLMLMLAQSKEMISVTSNILAVVCHVLIVVHLGLTGWLHFRSVTIGAAAALLYLLMPYTAVLLLSTSQVVASLFIVLAVTWYRWPMLAGLFLGLGTGFGFFPAILIPAWMGFYYRRGHLRFLMTFLAVCAGFIIIMVAKEGFAQVWQTIWSQAEWQAWKFTSKPTADGLWNTVSLHVAYRIPLLIAFVALVITSAFWPHPKHLGQLISWSATLILGVQFWYADAGGTYILWYLPLVVLQTVRPSTTELRPAVIDPERDRLTRILTRLMPWKRKAPDSITEAPVPSQALAG